MIEFVQAVSTARYSKARIALGIFLLVLVVYVLSSPGRIDIIDGQARFDVAYNWLHAGQPLLTDSLIKPWMAVAGQHGLPYSYYGAPASVLPMPLLALGGLYDGMGLGTSQFLFSLTCPILGAGIGSILFLLYIELGLSLRQALFWTIVSTFATMLWPASTSTFDNTQHAFFAITALYIAALSARIRSNLLAAVSGLVAGVLILYQAYFLLVIPALALGVVKLPVREETPPRHPETPGVSIVVRAGRAVHDYILADIASLRWISQASREARQSMVRFVCFIFAVSGDLLLSGLYNNLRFGSYWSVRKLHATMYPVRLLGNPVSGLSTLLLSPGKSIFLYSPVLILGILGFRSLRRRRPEIALATLAASIALILFLSCISFAGGDWCWGPRYLVVVLPLWALSFPFAQLRRSAILGLVSLGFLVQGLGLSVDHQRFFFERGFNDYFWAEDSWCYFKHSALFARFGEALSLSHAAPPQATNFNSIPDAGWSTYAMLGPPKRMPRSLAPQWMLHFRLFYLPRPWPFWMPTIDPAARPVKMAAWLWGLAGTGLIGLVLILPVLKIRKDIFTAETDVRVALGAGAL
ncbi:MAG: hypothetical protein DMG60_02350 [Acidobacteria bacterium]|nr:MAG: hypothetical protein DMG60_02350 [Acidobacteriota bacterium]